MANLTIKVITEKKGSANPDELHGLARQGYGPLQSSPDHTFGGLVRSLRSDVDVNFMATFPVYQVTREKLVVALETFGVELYAKRFLILNQRAPDPKAAGYIQQWRFVPVIAMEYYFRLDPAEVPEQPVLLNEAVAQVAEKEKNRLIGLEDEAFFREAGIEDDAEDDYFERGMGIYVENSYFQIVRLWSRAFGVPK